MIIKSMKFSNFRQFYGDHEIEFGTDNKNTTLIIGANGNGKTGIFRALMFVLYGDTRLEQDNDSHDVNIVNLDMLSENEFSPVTAKVELLFEYENQNFIIKREIVSIKNDGHIATQQGDPELYIISENGDFTPYSLEPNQMFINRILNPKIREFFFFDAERMQLLDTTKSEKALSKEVQDGIIRLLQIKYLNDAIGQLENLKRYKQREINRQVNSKDLDDKSKEKEKLQSKIKEYEIDLESLRKERRRLDEQIQELQLKLSENKDIKELQTIRNDKIRILEKTKENRKLHKDKIEAFLLEGINLLGNDIITKNKDHFKEYIERSSDSIPLPLLEQSLNDKTCLLCHTDIVENSVQHLSIQKLIDNYKSSELTPIINGILATNNDLSSSDSLYIRKVGNLLKDLVDSEGEIEKIIREIERIDEQIGDRASNIENLSILEKNLKRYERDSKKINSNIIKTESLLQLSMDNLEDLEVEIEKLSDKFEKVKKDNQIKKMLDRFKEVLKETMKEFSYSVTLELSENIYSNFIKLLDKKDVTNYKEVVINEKFEIKLMNRLEQNVVQDLSMGQSQIFTLAFILSLAQIASKGRNEVNSPLFMDTPFARLSRDNRDNLIESIPNLTNQWILLLTDTEFTDKEQELFEKYNKVGKIYVLNNYRGRTTIESYNSLSDISREVYYA